MVKKILLAFVDFGIETFDVFDVRGYYKKPINDYRDWRKKHNFSTKDLYRLRKEGYIVRTDSGYELTAKSITKIQEFSIEGITIQNPETWDGKWRLILFDIPETKKRSRDAFRRKINELGFVMVQKSVFCYPHDCIEEITKILKFYELEPYVTFLEVTEIITGKNLIKIFTEKDLL